MAVHSRVNRELKAVHLHGSREQRAYHQPRLPLESGASVCWFDS